jgi:Ni,Fe-hydrogenase maturation factor
MKTFFKKENLQKFLSSYELTVKDVVQSLDIEETLKCDHLGCLLHDAQEFDEVSSILLSYSKQIKEIELHESQGIWYRYLLLPIV